MNNKRMFLLYLCLIVLMLNSSCYIRESEGARANITVGAEIANNPPGQANIKGNTANFELQGKSLEAAFFEQKMPEMWLEFTNSGKTERVELPAEAKTLLEKLHLEAIENYHYNEINCFPERKEGVDRDMSLGSKFSKTTVELQKIQINTPAGRRLIGYREATDLSAFITKSIAKVTQQAREFRDGSSACQR